METPLANVGHVASAEMLYSCCCVGQCCVSYQIQTSTTDLSRSSLVNAATITACTTNTTSNGSNPTILWFQSGDSITLHDCPFPLHLRVQTTGQSCERFAFADACHNCRHLWKNCSGGFHDVMLEVVDSVVMNRGPAGQRRFCAAAEQSRGCTP